MFIFHCIVVYSVFGGLTACLPMAVQAGNPRFQEALSHDHSMVMLHNLREGTTKLVELKETDERLSSYSVFDCRWSTELQGFIGRLRFLGGVPEGSKVFADGGLFLIPVEGVARVVTNESPEPSDLKVIGSGAWSQPVVDDGGYPAGNQCSVRQRTRLHGDNRFAARPHHEQTPRS